ncbi:MAG: flagellar basal body rod protein FlgB [Planctomycetota bacterium]|jgi:flagellar basal-body rod protein FlgB
MGITDKNIEVLSKLLDLTNVKNKVIANNIANVNTPGYKKLEVTFQEELRKAIKSKDVEKINKVSEKIALSNNPITRKDGSNVDMDRELVEFFKSSDRHNIGLEILSKKFKGIISAIVGR